MCLNISFYWVKHLETISLYFREGVRGARVRACSVDTGKGKHPPKVPNSDSIQLCSRHETHFRRPKHMSTQRNSLTQTVLSCCFLWSAHLLLYYPCIYCCCVVVACGPPICCMTHVAVVVDCYLLTCCCIATPAVLVACYQCICYCVSPVQLSRCCL